MRVINKTTNYYQHIKDGKKVFSPQSKGDSWAIRKPMHKDTVFGEINLRRIKDVSLKEAMKHPKDIADKELREKILELMALQYNEKKIKLYFDENKDVWSDVNTKKISIYFFTKETNERFFATRKVLDTSFDKKKIQTQVADTAIQKILLKHLSAHEDNAEIAFSPDGIDEMNQNIIELNDGKCHQPMFKVRVYEKAEKFAVGQQGSKKKKFVEAAKGTNLFFAIYEEEQIDNKTGNAVMVRSFDTIPLNVVIDREKHGLSPAPENKNGTKPKYVLSPNDFVYVPTEEEKATGRIRKPLNKERIYKMVSCTGKECYFVPYSSAKPIYDKVEYFSLNKMGRALSGEMIKEICIPLSINRIGEITICE